MLFGPSNPHLVSLAPSAPGLPAAPFFSTYPPLHLVQKAVALHEEADGLLQELSALLMQPLPVDRIRMLDLSQRYLFLQEEAQLIANAVRERRCVHPLRRETVRALKESYNLLCAFDWEGAIGSRYAWQGASSLWRKACRALHKKAGRRRQYERPEFCKQPFPDLGLAPSPNLPLSDFPRPSHARLARGADRLPADVSRQRYLERLREISSHQKSLSSIEAKIDEQGRLLASYRQGLWGALRAKRDGISIVALQQNEAMAKVQRSRMQRRLCELRSEARALSGEQS